MIGIIVNGTPAPQGSKRHVGGGIMIESSKLVAPWREAVKWATLKAMHAHGIGRIIGPVKVEITFSLCRPKNAAKRRYPANKPDIDKLLRSTFDALSDAGIWEDDSRVVDQASRKVFVAGPDLHALPTPGAVIFIYSLSSAGPEPNMSPAAFDPADPKGAKSIP